MVNHGDKMHKSLQAYQSNKSVEILRGKEKKLNSSVLSHDTKNRHSEVCLTLSQMTEFETS